MAGARSIRAGEAYVELFGDDTRLQRMLSRSGRRMQRFAADARALGTATFAAVAGTVTPIAAVSLRAASDAQEIRNRFDQVFKEQADQAGAFADQLGEQVGRSGTKLRRTLSNFMSFFLGLGYGREQASSLSQELTRLSVDFASFNNLTDEDATRRFVSAMAGSSEVVDRFGINLKVAALDLELQRQGLADNVQTADELSKAYARYSIIARSMGEQGAVGDALRTAAMFANQERRAKDELFDLADGIGQALIPTATKLLTEFNELVEGTTEWVTANQDTVVALFETAAAIAGVGAGVAALGVAIGVLLNPIGLATVSIGGLVAAMQTTDWGQASLRELGDMFEDTTDSMSEAWGLFVDQILDGRLDNAGEVAALGFKIAFFEAIDDIETELERALDQSVGMDGLTEKIQNRLAVYFTDRDQARDVIREQLRTLYHNSEIDWAQWIKYRDSSSDQKKPYLTWSEMVDRVIGDNAEQMRILEEEMSGRGSDRLARLRRDLDMLRQKYERERENDPDAGGPGGPGDDERNDNRRRMLSSSPIGNLRGEAALNLLAGAAGTDRVAGDVKSIRESAQDIAANTAEMGRFG